MGAPAGLQERQCGGADGVEREEETSAGGGIAEMSAFMVSAVSAAEVPWEGPRGELAALPADGRRWEAVDHCAGCFSSTSLTCGTSKESQERSGVGQSRPSVLFQFSASLLGERPGSLEGTRPWSPPVECRGLGRNRHRPAEGSGRGHTAGGPPGLSWRSSGRALRRALTAVTAHAARHSWVMLSPNPSYLRL